MLYSSYLCLSFLIAWYVVPRISDGWSAFLHEPWRKSPNPASTCCRPAKSVVDGFSCFPLSSSRSPSLVVISRSPRSLNKLCQKFDEVAKISRYLCLVQWECVCPSPKFFCECSVYLLRLQSLGAFCLPNWWRRNGSDDVCPFYAIRNLLSHILICICHPYCWSADGLPRW